MQNDHSPVRGFYLYRDGTLPAYKLSIVELFASGETAVCDECAKLDKEIGHYRTLMARITDPLTDEGLRKLIEQMKAQKAVLHTQPKM
jgi:hypothetical protein